MVIEGKHSQKNAFGTGKPFRSTFSVVNQTLESTHVNSEINARWCTYSQLSYPHSSNKEIIVICNYNVHVFNG